jgi:hypothetical protein
MLYGQCVEIKATSAGIDENLTERTHLREIFRVSPATTQVCCVGHLLTPLELSAREWDVQASIPSGEVIG